MIIIRIAGNITSLKDSILMELEELIGFIDAEQPFPYGLACRLASITGRINREVAVITNRKGRVLTVSVGDSSKASLPETEGRKDRRHTSGLICFHTHPNGDGRPSDVDLASLLELRLDAMVSIGVRAGEIYEVYAALPVIRRRGQTPGVETAGPFKAENEELLKMIEMISERAPLVTFPDDSDETAAERAILVGIETSGSTVVNGRSEGERLLDELNELAGTAGVEVVGRILQKRSVKDAAYLIGRGKLEEIALLRQTLNAGTVIFDDELTGAQIRNIEELTGAKVIDRTLLILDIFAQRARSSEGKLQVELAQLKYRLPRLMGMGGQLSRLGGGIGTRGPGEKKLEVDRRHIRHRISILEGELRELERRRALIRESGMRSTVPVIALVGYTNAGKSTLMNTICGSDIFAEDKLFATLDPTTRKFLLPDGREALLVDTVGFIRKLPHELIEAFKSTLEEAVYADALVHVVDSSDAETDIHIKVAEDLLKELGALNKPVILALNKCDLLTRDSRIAIGLHAGRTIELSALSGKGIPELLKALSETIIPDEENVTLNVPYNDGWVMPFIRRNGRVLNEEYTGSGILITAVVKKQAADKLCPYREPSQKQPE